MLNVFITWQPFKGYFFNGDMRSFHIADGCITFYNDNGETYDVKLDYGCQFCLPLKNVNSFKVHKKVDFTKNEAFGVKVARRSSLDEKNSIRLYIPMSAVDFKIGNEYDERIGDIIWTRQNVTLNVEYYRTYGGQSHPNVGILNDKQIFVKVIKSSRYTDDYNHADALAKEINENCHTSISALNVLWILEKYNITRK